MAGGLGLEPRLTESESAFLPLEDPPMRKNNATQSGCLITCMIGKIQLQNLGEDIL